MSQRRRRSHFSVTPILPTPLIDALKLDLLLKLYREGPQPYHDVWHGEGRFRAMRTTQSPFYTFRTAVKRLHEGGMIEINDVVDLSKAGQEWVRKILTPRRADAHPRASTESQSHS